MSCSKQNELLVMQITGISARHAYTPTQYAKKILWYRNYSCAQNFPLTQKVVDLRFIYAMAQIKLQRPMSIFSSKNYPKIFMMPFAKQLKKF